MAFALSWAARHRLACALPVVVALSFVAQPVTADNRDPQAQVDNAQQSLKDAQNHANAEDGALQQAQTSLASYSAQLAALQHRITALDAQISADGAALKTLDYELATDRDRLAAYVRQTYENGGAEAALTYIISAKDISTAMQRKQQVDHVATAAQQLIDRIHQESSEAQQTLGQDRGARADLTASQQQLATQQALVAVQAEQVQAADVAAHQAVNHASDELTLATQTLLAERAAGTVFTAIAGSTFTVDTDLTQGSGENATNLDNFLQGTPMAGLGDSFVRAEQRYHVSARYFVAHAILESDWGQSAIAQNKHNLFGFNANDSNPYGDASSFNSFDACVQDVAQFIASNYLSPHGHFFHGPTLRGMNVDYATDPNWAAKIAHIAQTIP
ncbi:MAG: glucosaminidase domain-containing protein [Candidatus Dormibacteria bacterium]